MEKFNLLNISISHKLFYNTFRAIIKNDPSKGFHGSWQAGSQVQKEAERVENGSHALEEGGGGTVNLWWLKQEKKETCMHKRKHLTGAMEQIRGSGMEHVRHYTGTITFPSHHSKKFEMG